MITPEECEARVWRDDNLMREALNDHDSLPYFLRVIKDDRDAMSRNERAWDLICAAVKARAEVMADELNEQARLDREAAKDEWADDPRHLSIRVIGRELR